MRTVNQTSPSEKSDVDSFRVMKDRDVPPKSYRVDESARRITISLIDQESGKIISRLSPEEAVSYVKHLNEAIKNMINEVA